MQESEDKLCFWSGCNCRCEFRDLVAVLHIGVSSLIVLEKVQTRGRSVELWGKSSSYVLTIQGSPDVNLLQSSP